jgi:hypothetical protein
MKCNASFYNFIAKDIGTGHIDDNRANITLQDFKGEGKRKSWDEVRKELEDILDELETQINNKIKQA